MVCGFVVFIYTTFFIFHIFLVSTFIISFFVKVV